MAVRLLILAKVSLNRGQPRKVWKGKELNGTGRELTNYSATYLKTQRNACYMMNQTLIVNFLNSNTKQNPAGCCCVHSVVFVDGTLPYALRHHARDGVDATWLRLVYVHICLCFFCFVLLF